MTGRSRLKRQVEADTIVRAIREAADPSGTTAGYCQRLLPGIGACRVLSIGKAGATMLRAAASVLGDRVTASMVVAPDATLGIRGFPPGTARIGSDHPAQTERSVEAAVHARRFVSEADGPLVVLLSGGGSAMIAEPVDGITLEMLVGVSDALMRSGATIDELNCVRKQLDTTKGGGLGLSCNGRSVFVGVVSDVVGDQLDVVSSGPFFGDTTTPDDACRVLDRHGIRCTPVEQVLRARVHTNPKPDDPRLHGIRHDVLTSNRAAAEAAGRAVRPLLALEPKTAFDQQGEAAGWGRAVAAHLRHGPGAMVIGGEPVVSGIPTGAKGGPMQEAVLTAAAGLAGVRGWLLVGIATDGIDGPTDAGGAIIDDTLAAEIVDAETRLAEHRSYAALDRAGALVRTGPTGTNVNDVLVGIRWPEGADR